MKSTDVYVYVYVYIYVKLRAYVNSFYYKLLKSTDIMRLIIDTRGNNGGAGFNRYKGEGIFMPLGRKHTGLKKVKDDMVKDKIADAGHLKEKFVGKGINASTNSMENVDAVDSPNTNESSNLDSDEQSFMETISNSSKETVADEDKETVTDDEEKPAHNGEENRLACYGISNKLSNYSHTTAFGSCRW